MVEHAFNPRTRETEADGSLLIQGHPGLHKIDPVFLKEKQSSHKGDPALGEIAECPISWLAGKKKCSVSLGVA